jgi:hypothetical protein
VERNYVPPSPTPGSQTAKGRKERNILEGAHLVGNNLEPDLSGQFSVLRRLIAKNIDFDLTGGHMFLHNLGNFLPG